MAAAAESCSGSQDLPRGGEPIRRAHRQQLGHHPRWLGNVDFAAPGPSASSGAPPMPASAPVPALSPPPAVAGPAAPAEFPVFAAVLLRRVWLTFGATGERSRPAPHPRRSRLYSGLQPGERRQMWPSMPCRRGVRCCPRPSALRGTGHSALWLEICVYRQPELGRSCGPRCRDWWDVVRFAASQRQRRSYRCNQTGLQDLVEHGLPRR